MMESLRLITVAKNLFSFLSHRYLLCLGWWCRNFTERSPLVETSEAIPQSLGVSWFLRVSQVKKLLLNINNPVLQNSSLNYTSAPPLKQALSQGSRGMLVNDYLVGF